jgi:hypothetical protein
MYAAQKATSPPAQSDGTLVAACQVDCRSICASRGGAGRHMAPLRRSSCALTATRPKGSAALAIPRAPIDRSLTAASHGVTWRAAAAPGAQPAVSPRHGAVRSYRMRRSPHCSASPGGSGAEQAYIILHYHPLGTMRGLAAAAPSRRAEARRGPGRGAPAWEHSIA